MPGSIDDVSRTIGRIESDVKTLFRRADEDREEADKRHNENQGAMAQMRESMQGAFSELRRSIEDLTREIKSSPPSAVMSKRRMAVLASIGLVTLWLIGYTIEAGFSWAVQHVLNMKFGSG